MRHLVSLINRIFAVASGYLLLVILFLSIADLSIRNLGYSWLGILELAMLIVVAAIFFGLGYCEEKDGHVRVTLLLDRLPLRSCAAVRCIDETIALIGVGFLTYACFRATYLAYIGDNALMAGTLALYTWPTRLAMSVGLLCYTAQIFLNLITEVRNLLAKEPVRSPLTEQN